MKKTILLFTIIIISILLLGCNIKIGDGILTVSEDGVQYVTGDQSNTININNDTNNIDNENGSDDEVDGDALGTNDSKNRDAGQSESDAGSSPSGLDVPKEIEMDDLKKMAEELAKIGEELLEDFKSNEFQSNSKFNQAQCEEGIDQNYSEVQDKLNHEFYFPPCSHLVSVKEQGQTVQFVLEQRFNEIKTDSNEEYVNQMKAIEAAYVELGGRSVYENFIHYADSYGEVKFYLHENNRGHTHVYFVYWGDHIEITVNYKNS